MNAVRCERWLMRFPGLDFEVLIQYTVQVLRVQEVPWVACFDGIWACASLLHG